MQTHSVITIFLILAACISACIPAEAAKPVTPPSREQSLKEQLGGRRFDRGQIRLRVEKSKFLLTVLYRGRTVKSYPVVLGANPVDDKLCEGDGRTPEGEFRIAGIRSPHKWSKFLLLSYPTTASRRRFLAARQSGKIPATAAIGGAIGIHGVPKGHDNAIDARQNWTAGCISLKTHDIDELASLCRRGTPVQILH